MSKGPNGPVRSVIVNERDSCFIWSAKVKDSNGR